jgi:very-short-patch-repair endonuclease
MPRPTASPLQRALALAATQHGLLAAAQCRELGISRNTVQRLIARGTVSRVAPGVYRVVGTPRTWEGRALAAVLATGPGALVSHGSAAHLWGLRGFPPPGRIDVTVPRHARPRRRPGVTVHETAALDLADPRRRRGVPVTGPARTVLDVAAMTDELVVLRALDEMRRLGHASWGELWEALLAHARPGRRGIGLARQALRTRDGRRVPDTEFARLFLRLIEARGLPQPESEVRVTVGGRRYRLDCAYVRQRIAIELDGRDHLRPEVYDGDRVRDNQLELDRWLVLRYTWRRFTTRPDEIVDEIRAALTARAGGMS